MNARDFVAIGPERDHQLLPWQPSALMLVAFIAVIGLSAAGVLPLLKSLLVLLAAYIVMGLVSVDEVRRRFPFELVMVMGGALTLSQAMVGSGLAGSISYWLTHFSDGWSPLALLVLMYLVTWLLTELVTNAAAAAIIFPIALTASEQLGVSPYPFIVTVAFAASASFLSPYGYQTNLMVFSIGRYRIKDYLKAGLPLWLAYSAITMALIPMVFPF